MRPSSRNPSRTIAARSTGALVAVVFLLALSGCGSPSEPRDVQLELVEGPRSVQVESEIELAVRVRDLDGTPAAGVSVDWLPLVGRGTLSALSTRSDADGIATILWTVGDEAGNGRLRAEVGDRPPVVIVIEILPGDLATIELDPPSASVAQVGETFTFTALGRDAFRNRIFFDAGDLDWSSSDDAVATVSIAGEVMGEADGAAIVSAERDGVTGSAVFQVGEVDPNLVVFPSQQLEAAVRAAIGKPSGFLERSDLADLEELTAVGLGINSLTGLEAAVALESLDLRENAIGDLTPLRELPLETLLLENNLIEDIGPLGVNPVIKTLDLAGNQIREIDAAAGLVQISDLDLARNKIREVIPLLDNPGLDLGDFVDLEQNPLTVQTVCQHIPILNSRGVEVRFSGSCGGQAPPGG